MSPLHFGITLLLYLKDEHTKISHQTKSKHNIHRFFINNLLLSVEVKKLERTANKRHQTMPNIHQLSPLDMATNYRTPFYKRQQTIAVNDEELSPLDIATNSRKPFINRKIPRENSSDDGGDTTLIDMTCIAPHSTTIDTVVCICRSTIGTTLSNSASSLSNNCKDEEAKYNLSSSTKRQRTSPSNNKPASNSTTVVPMFLGELIPSIRGAKIHSCPSTCDM